MIHDTPKHGKSIGTAVDVNVHDGRLTADTGALLLRQADQKLQLAKRINQIVNDRTIGSSNRVFVAECLSASGIVSANILVPTGTRKRSPEFANSLLLCPIDLEVELSRRGIDVECQSRCIGGRELFVD